MKFDEAVRMHGKDWKKVAQHIGTKDISQVRSYLVTLRSLIKKNPDSLGVDILPFIA